MKKKLLIFINIFLLGGCGTALDETLERIQQPFHALIEATEKDVKEMNVLAGSYLVAFKNELPNGGLHFPSYFSEYKAHYLALTEQFSSSPDIKDIHYLTSLDLSKMESPLWQPRFLGPPGINLRWDKKQGESSPASITRVDFQDNESAKKTLRDWIRNGKIWYAEPNYMSSLAANEKTFADFATTYNDIQTNNTDVTWFNQINLIEGFQKLGGTDIATTTPPLVAVMDSGVDYAHEALRDNIWENRQEGVNQAGCLLDWYGCNTTQSTKGFFGNGDVWPAGLDGPGVSCASLDVQKQKACLHGTHVAGIIAAKPQNNYGGICPICKIMIIKVVGKTKSGEGDVDSIIDSSIVAGFAYISRFKRMGDAAVRLINVSFGKFQRSRTVEMLIRSLKKQGRGSLVIGAAGNEDTMVRQYPAAFSDVIAVSNVNSDTGQKHWASNFGAWVDIAAPGGGLCSGSYGKEGIRSTIPGNISECMPGTSMSAPVVSGVAGLLLIQNPEITSEQLRGLLIETSDPKIYQIRENQPYLPKASHAPNPIPLLGAGIVNVGNALDRTIPEGKVIQRDYNRVSSGCGTIGLKNPEHLSLKYIWIITLIIPLLLLKSCSRKRAQIYRQKELRARV